MSGYTENRIVILKPYDEVFDLSNQIEYWPRLFTEYQKAEVLKKEGNELLFQLTTFPSEGRPSRTWTSKRTLDKANARATAERLDPLFPFAYMHICWEYETLPQNIGTIMTWMQTFDVHPECPFTVTEMESFLNKNTHVQIKAVKQAIEQWEE